MNELPVIPDILLDVVFAILLFIGVIAIISDRHAETAIASTLLLLVWFLVDTLGRSLFLALIVLTLIVATRLLTEGANTLLKNSEEWSIVPLVDDLLTDSDND